MTRKQPSPSQQAGRASPVSPTNKENSNSHRSSPNKDKNTNPPKLGGIVAKKAVEINVSCLCEDQSPGFRADGYVSCCVLSDFNWLPNAQRELLSIILFEARFKWLWIEWRYSSLPL
jgi:hypothetical protein